ncbi:cell wall protein AWA1-like isoform X3 [Mugil cephalus]|uniref:cell wall protein AWA1-like isoform X3 n=1 Tax=Mugil cephalus TaxID=48193 RepID=UPI001FB665C8|nr:cell wall protein AWA1-like isoform X3 [Mugil cephalus]
MWALLFLCSVLITHGPQVAPQETDVPEGPSCRNNCGGFTGSCYCDQDCQQNGDCCPDYNYYCSPTTVTPETTTPWITVAPEGTTTTASSCRHNCGGFTGSCYCDQACQQNGDCCPDYSYYCSPTTVAPETTTTTVAPEVTTTTVAPEETEVPPGHSCRNNCGGFTGSCYCDQDCQQNGDCCPDYNYYCSPTTVAPETTTPWITVAPEGTTTTASSCRHNCGGFTGSCYCDQACQQNGDCCPDYSYYCSPTTVAPATTTPWTTVAPQVTTTTGM